VLQVVNTAFELQNFSRTAIGFISELQGTTIGFIAIQAPGIIMQHLQSLNSPHCTKVGHSSSPAIPGYVEL
jgi:hypothetical protein